MLEDKFYNCIMDFDYNFNYKSKRISQNALKNNYNLIYTVNLHKEEAWNGSSSLDFKVNCGFN